MSRRRGRRGRGRGAPPPEAASSSEDSALTAWNSAPPPLIPASSSSSVASLTSEVQSKLTLQDPAPVALPLSHSQRPGYGTVGKKVMVCANHFLVKVANTDIHQYDVSLPISSLFIFISQFFFFNILSLISLHLHFLNLD